MININENNVVGKGHHRDVYRHPENPDLCIKITVDEKITGRKEQRERKYYIHLQKRNISWDMIPKYHGEIETNLGMGSVFDLILDYDGCVSKTLGDYISTSQIMEPYYDNLLNSLNSLKKYLLEHWIVTSRLAHRNVLCQRDKSGISQLFVVDNIGNAEFIPICNHSAWLARRKISRKWKRFEDSLIKYFPDNKALHKMLEAISK